VSIILLGSGKNGNPHQNAWESWFLALFEQHNNDKSSANDAYLYGNLNNKDYELRHY
jgi:hypothetical protein